MTDPINLRLMRPGEEVEVCNLVARSFNEFVAPDFGEDGIEEFFNYSNPRALRKRSEGDHFVLVAEAEGAIAGMIEIREMRHVSMLFVDKAFHRRGIAKNLFKRSARQDEIERTAFRESCRTFLALRRALLRKTRLRPDGRGKNHTRRNTYLHGAQSIGR